MNIRFTAQSNLRSIYFPLVGIWNSIQTTKNNSNVEIKGAATTGKAEVKSEEVFEYASHESADSNGT